MFEELPQDSPN